jgi:N-dimethylarginine dimethylaminohydrolase
MRTLSPAERNPMAQPRILMCPPDFYGIEYEINPWMSRSRASDRAVATSQWSALADILRALGVQVDVMTPREGLPDLVFTANAGLIYRDTFYSARFRHSERARESPVFDAWFAGHGFVVQHLPEGMYHEGAGDALFCGDALFAGYRIRSDVRGHQWLGQTLGVRVLPLELVNPYFYHLDTCFCPLAPGVAIWNPAAFAAALREHGYETIPTPLDEFIKAGGSAKCLTLRLDGEEAAAWRTV